MPPAPRRRRARPGNPLLAVAYVRVSTAEQHLGPEAQRAAIEAWAARGGVDVAAWHTDHGVGGATDHEARPGLVAALAALRQLGAGVLVVQKRDRLARDIGVAVAIDRAAEASGARVQAADGVGNGAEAADQLMRTLLDAVAQHELSLIQSRTRAALAVKKARGELTGSAPLGWQVGADGRTLEQHPAEQLAIATMRELRAAGVSYEKIAARLTADGLPSRSGRRWHPTQVQRALSALAAKRPDVQTLERPSVEAPPAAPHEGPGLSPRVRAILGL